MSDSPISQLNTTLVNEITTLLAENRFEEALTAINDNKYNSCLKDNSFDLIPAIVKHLDKKTSIDTLSLFECCENLLQIVADKSNPEEALLEFIEQAEYAKEDVKFLSILKALQHVLLRLKNKRGHSLEWTFSTIQLHLNEFPLPGNYDLDNEEKTLLDADSSVDRVTQFYTELIPFYSPFIEEVSLPNNPLPIHNKTRDIIISSLLRLLGKPLAALDLECDARAKSRARICAEKIMKNLSQLTGNSFRFLEYNQRPKFDTNLEELDSPIQDVFLLKENVPSTSFGVYYYLLLSENIQYQQIPLVYNPVYIFQSILYFVVELLKQPEEYITRKGLLLAHTIICNTNIKKLSADLLDSSAHCNFCRYLSEILIYSGSKENRVLGINIFKAYLFKFDMKGRYLLISNLMETIKNINARGYLIMQYKEMLAEVFRDDENKISEYFSGAHLIKMIDIFCTLPEGSESDLIETGDQIISSINLLIFLAIRDKYNATGIWNHFNILERTFLKPLREGLQISKKHYELKIEETNKEKEGNDPQCTIKVKGQYLPQMSRQDKLNVLYSALNSFATLEMLLVRLEELIEEGSPINI